MSSDSQTGVQQEHTAVCPGRQEAAVVWWRLEIWVVVYKGLVDILEGWGCDCRWADGEGEAVGLVYVVVGILSDHDCFDCIEGCVARPDVLVLDMLVMEWRKGYSMYQEYTSAAGGKIFAPASCSFFRNRFRSRNSLVNISSFNSFSQVSSSVSISNPSSSFCSGVNFLTQASLSNLVGAGSGAATLDLSEEEAEALAAEVVAAAFGAWKNEVIEPLALGFFESEEGSSAPLRLRDIFTIGRKR